MELVFEIAHCPQTPYDGIGADLPNIIDQKTLKRIHLDAMFQRLSHQGILDQFPSFFQSEKRFLPLVNRNGYDDTVKNLEGALEKIQMSVGDGIE